MKYYIAINSQGYSVLKRWFWIFSTVHFGPTHDLKEAKRVCDEANG